MRVISSMHLHGALLREDPVAFKLGLAHARKHLSSCGPPACMHGRDAITLQRSNLMSAKMLHAWCVRSMFDPSGFKL